jgi:DNA polymerase-3 subunit epsilon
MKFIALDFETANSERGSACEIGLVKVENFKIVEKISFLIKPKDNYFDFYNTEIHGIDEKTVENELEFNEIYKLLKSDFENYPLIAHYATFDMSVLRHTLDLYNIDYPKTIYSCTYQLAKQAFKGEFSYRLDALCKNYGIKLEHHRALSDANACAEIAIKIFKEKGITKFENIEQEFDLKLGKLFRGGFKGSVKTFKNSLKLSDLDIDETKFNSENPFYSQKVVFTGTL